MSGTKRPWSDFLLVGQNPSKLKLANAAIKGHRHEHVKTMTLINADGYLFTTPYFEMM